MYMCAIKMKYLVYFQSVMVVLATTLTCSQTGSDQRVYLVTVF